MEKKYDATVRVHPQEIFIRKMPADERKELLDKWNHAKDDSNMVVTLWNFPIDAYVDEINDTMPIRPFGFLHEEAGHSKDLRRAITAHAAKGLDIDFENELHLVDAQHYYALASAEFAAKKLAGFFHNRGIRDVRIEGTLLPSKSTKPKNIDDFDNDSCVKKVAEVLANNGFNVDIDLSRTYDSSKNKRGPEKTIKVVG